jgi:hypothetical protein
MKNSASVSRLSPEQEKEIRLQTLAAQQGLELYIASDKIYCSSEFHYKTFASLDEAEAYLMSERLKRQCFGSR